jgi:hypothetical protein
MRALQQADADLKASGFDVTKSLGVGAAGWARGGVGREEAAGTAQAALGGAAGLRFEPDFSNVKNSDAETRPWGLEAPYLLRVSNRKVLCFLRKVLLRSFGSAA